MAGSITPPASGCFAISKSDSVNFTTRARGIYVGGTGDVVILPSKDSTTTVTFSAVPVGTILPVECWRVNSTNTTATLMIGLI